MAELRPRQLWMRRAAYVALSLGIIFFHLLPLETTPRRWAGPDLLLALTAVLSLRRPEAVPVLSVALVMLLADLLFQRPPGLWAALVVLSSAWLKRRARSLRDAPFIAEWLTAAVAFGGVALGYRLALGVTMTPTTSLGLSLIQAMMTALFYPAVVLAVRLVLGARAPRRGEGEGMGARA